MAVSEFVKRKLAMAYYRFDFDGDGVVSQRDFELLGLTVAELRGLESGSAQADQIVEAHKGWWDAYFKGGDADGDGQVSLEEYLAFVDAWVGRDPDAIVHAIEGNQLVFDTIDLDHDAKLSFEEFSRYLMAYGLADDDANTAFEHLDLDRDRFISRAEFAKAMSEYYISEERPSPSEWFFGGHYRPPNRAPPSVAVPTSSLTGQQVPLSGPPPLDDGPVGEALPPESTDVAQDGRLEIAGKDVAPVDGPLLPVGGNDIASRRQRGGGNGTASAAPGLDGELALLGGFVFSVGGDTLLGISAGSRLLAFLAVSDRMVTRNLVAGTLWPESSDDQAGASLRSTLARLHGPARHAVTVTAHDLSLAEGVAVDVHHSQTLARRLVNRDAQPVENDIGALAIAAEDWRQLRIHALEAVAARLTAAGRLGEAATAALVAVRAEPLRETARAALIRVHLAEGDQSRAVGEFERYRVLLRAELGVEPTSRLVELLSGLERR